ncbi:hypothetical protein [Corynebacterium urinipleomorphum]|uniref:hypothetical protein n=1 Tax=Corynebacterium urinipleomorphum TaxID=1852380 RepID=UPI001177A947|nr:hypothetical protein [Corynebacterium urinipleomorphum]
MFYDPEKALSKHNSTFANGIARSLDLSRLAGELSEERSTLAIDISNSSVVMAVGSLDLLCKNIQRESLLSYLYGFLEPPEKVRKVVPLTVARLVTDAARHPNKEPAFGSHHLLAASFLDRELSRDNFQGINNVATLFTSLGLGKLKNFMNKGEYADFSAAVTELTEFRHEIVHRTAVQFNPYQFPTVDDISRRSVTPEAANALKAGGEALVNRVKAFIA